MDIDNLEQWSFGMTEEMANGLLALVLAGKKRATASSLRGYEVEGEPIPRAGERSVITDWEGTPRCVIETVRVSVIPYGEMPWELARLEGEDETLESWRANHERFFREEGAEIGYAFTEDMPVVFEEFEVIEIL